MVEIWPKLKKSVGTSGLITLLIFERYDLTYQCLVKEE